MVIWQEGYMVSRVHVIDPDVRRRARVSRELNTFPLHVEIYEHLDEFLKLAPREGLVLAADDSGSHGQQVTKIIQTENIGLPIIGYAEEPSTEAIVEAMLAGAAGYLTWPFTDRQLLSTLDRLSGGGERRLRRERNLSRAREKVNALSPRERQVLSALVAGQSNREIALALNISPRTVEIHRSNMMTKLQAGSVADAVRIGLYAGLDESWDVPNLGEVA